MTTVNQDYPGHQRPRPSNSPHIPAMADSHQQHPQHPQHPQHSHSQAAVTDAWTEAFARLQQQVQYNTTAIEDQRRHLAEFNDVVRTLHAEIGSLWRKVDNLKDSRDARPPTAGAVKPDEADIDLLTSELQHVANKANEVDGLKVQLEIMTRRLRRLEGQPSPAVEAGQYQQRPPHAPQQYQQPASRLPPAGKPDERPQDRPHAHTQGPSEARHIEQAQAPNPRTPAFRAVDGPNAANAWRSTNHAGPPPEAPGAARPEGAPASGWNAVNNASFAKRTASVDGSSLHEGAPGSPKRQKLAPLAPRSGFEPANGHPAPHQHTYENTQPTRAVSGETHHAAGAPGAPIRFVPFPPRAESNGHEARRPEHADARKPSRSEETKPEPEWRDWASTNGDPYHRHPQHAYHLSATPSDPYRQLGYSPDHAHGDTPSPALHDSGKKSRTKPTRNADGILIRKDGRPDMRSISSAMNLRKVHAKKEAERGSGAGSEDTPTPGERDTSAARSTGSPPSRDDVPMADAEAKAT